jgi:hypothetical protein
LHLTLGSGRFRQHGVLTLAANNNRLKNIYTNNPLSGKPEKMERYYDGKITGVTTYYYQ